MLLLSIVFVLSFGLFLSSLLRTTSRVTYLLAVYLFATTNIIFNGFLAHFFHQLNSTWFFLGFEFCSLLGSYLAWTRSKKPPILGPWKTNQDLFPADWLRSSWRKRPAIWILGASVLAIYIFGAFLIFLVPPNTNDILTTHLTRIAFWLQHGDMLPWSTPNNFTLIYPVNANLLMLWIMLFTRSWMAAGFMQWFAALAGAAAIFGISRLLGWRRAGAFFASVIWMSLPEVLLQSTTTQLDLILAAFSVITVYFLIAGFKHQQRSELVLSGLALGLTIGTKQIALFLLPGFMLFILLIWLKDRQKYSRLTITWLISAGISSILLGSYIYIQNTILFRNPMGDAETLSQQLGGQKRWQIGDSLAYNSLRFFYQSLDPTGIPLQYADNFNSLKTGLLEPLFSTVGLDLEDPIAVHDPRVLFSYKEIPPIQEDRSWFGILGFFLIFFLTPIQLGIGIKMKDPFRVGLIGLSLTYSIFVIALRPGWDPYQGRYFIPAIAFTAPFFASLVRIEPGWRIVTWVIVIFSVITMFYATIANSGKPLLSGFRIQGFVRNSYPDSYARYRTQIHALTDMNFPAQRDIWDLDMTGRQLIQNGAMVKPVRMVEDLVPADASLALGFTRNLPVLPFFGHRLSRRIYQVYPAETLLDEIWFRENRIDFLLLDLRDPKLPPPPAWLELIDHSGDWALYRPAWAGTK